MCPASHESSLLQKWQHGVEANTDCRAGLHLDNVNMTVLLFSELHWFLFHAYSSSYLNVSPYANWPGLGATVSAMTLASKLHAWPVLCLSEGWLLSPQAGRQS